MKQEQRKIRASFAAQVEAYQKIGTGDHSIYSWMAAHGGAMLLHSWVHTLSSDAFYSRNIFVHFVHNIAKIKNPIEE